MNSNELPEYKLDNFKSIAYLNDHLYPQLNKAMNILIDYLIRTNEVRRHQQHLIEQKVKDKMEQKRIEKEKLKAELGSDYESSSESEDEADSMNNVQAQTQLLPQDEQIDEIPSGTDDATNSNVHLKEGDDLAPVIEEEDDVHEESSQKKKPEISIEVKKKNEFDPIYFLANTLKDIKEGKI